MSVTSRRLGLRREDVGAAGHVLLEQVVLDRAVQLRRGDALLAGRRDVHGQDRSGRGVDGHGGGDLVQRDLVEERLHVLQAADGHADLAHLALGQGMVAVVADLRGQVEGHREAGLALLQQVAVAAVGLLGAGEAGVLAHGPEAAAVHGRLDAAGEGVLAGEAGLVQVVTLDVVGGVDALHGEAGARDEGLLALR